MKKEDISLFKQIKCVEREINRRQWGYKKLIAGGKMTEQKANSELKLMAAVKDTLTALYGNQKIQAEQLEFAMDVCASHGHWESGHASN